METRNCQNCKKDFNIEAEDFSFYEKMKVPAPTFCPHCRFIRRVIWRNERSLYKRKCDMCSKSIISIYEDNVSFPVYCPTCYKSDKWDALDYASDYDFSVPFFEQWRKLFNSTPCFSLYTQGTCINSEYANMLMSAKNAYLSYSVISSEDVYFSGSIDNSKQIFDSYAVNESELVYEGMAISKNYNSKYTYWSLNSINCNFILNCNNCQDCFGCVNLHNKRYCVWNKQYTKEGFENEMKKYNLGSYSSVDKISQDFWIFSLRFPRKYANNINCISSIGDDLKNNKNTIETFNSYDSENLKYCYRCMKEKDAIDVSYNIGGSLVYEQMSGSTNASNIKFVASGNVDLRDSEYLYSCQSCSDVFGCISLRNKKYCILNKQYTKEEYFEMVDKIKKHMMDMPYVDARGIQYKYGEFFPEDLSPFAYNETVCDDFFPQNKNEIISNGHRYKDKIESQYKITMKSDEIPDDITSVNESILDEVLECSSTGRAFKITPFEFQFYKSMNIPIPRFHPDERYKNRLRLRNPMVLYSRDCMNTGCTNNFYTTYSPDRPEIIFCEECYKNEVY